MSEAPKTIFISEFDYNIEYIRKDEYNKAVDALKYINSMPQHNDTQLALYTRQEIAKRILIELGEVK
jgi:hypothetical protein